MKHKYSVNIVWSPDDKAFVAQVIELPGCCADGPTQAEALKNLQTVIDEWIETAQELGRDVPDPIDCTVLERMSEEFDAWVRQQVSREVETAVKRILEDLARNLPPMVMGNVAMRSGIIWGRSNAEVGARYIVAGPRAQELV